MATIAHVKPQLAELFRQTDGVLTAEQVLSTVSRSTLRTMVHHGSVHRVTHGIYSNRAPTTVDRLRAASLFYGKPVTACLGTAAQLYAFDTENTTTLHIHDPVERHVHGPRGISAHQRLGAPVERLDGQLLTGAAWTAVEAARALSRPRALATLDAALATRTCDLDGLRHAAGSQAGRRGIVKLRPLIDVADGMAQSPMESECRLRILDAGLPTPTLQHPVCDDWGMPRFYLDFAWQAAMVAGEYDGDQFHSTPLAVRRDKARVAWLQERGWLVVPITVDDVRIHHAQLISRLRHHLTTRSAA